MKEEDSRYNGVGRHQEGDLIVARTGRGDVSREVIQEDSEVLSGRQEEDGCRVKDAGRTTEMVTSFHLDSEYEDNTRGRSVP